MIAREVVTKDEELGRCVCRVCNLALIRSALLGVLLRDGSISLSAALDFLQAHHPAP